MRVQVGHRSQRERGAVAVTVALLAIPISMVTAFTVDLGATYAQARAFSGGADSAALAVVSAKRKVITDNPLAGLTCLSVKAADDLLATNDPAKAQNIALARVNATTNYGVQLTAAEVTTTLTCDANQVLQARVSVKHAVPTTLGAVAGVASLQADKSATAALGGVATVGDVRPVGVCRYQANDIMTHAAADKTLGLPYRAELIAMDKIWVSGLCGSAGSGNWGWIDCGQGNGASDLGDALLNGCPTPLTLTGHPPTLTLGGSPGNKGNSAHARSAMTAILDTAVTLPVYDTYVGNGNNATFTVTGFLELKICGFDGNIKGLCYDPSVGMGGNEIQVRYVSYTPVADLNRLCGIGIVSLTCAPNYNSYAVALVQ